MPALPPVAQPSLQPGPARPQVEGRGAHDGEVEALEALFADVVAGVLAEVAVL